VLREKRERRSREGGYYLVRKNKNDGGYKGSMKEKNRKREHVKFRFGKGRGAMQDYRYAKKTKARQTSRKRREQKAP